MDLSGYGDGPGWRALADLACELAEPRWPQFGRLRFPRLAVGALLLGGHVGPDDPEAAVTDLVRSRPPGAAVADTIRLLPRLLGLPEPPALGRWLPVRRRWREGIRFYADALRTTAEEAPSALRELAATAPAEADALLAEALFADLHSGYRAGFRPRKCLLLLDNAHSGTGRKALAALVRAAKESPAPVSVVATSGRLDLGIADLRDLVAAWAAMPTDRDPPRRTPGEATTLRLTPLTEQESAALTVERLGRAGNHLSAFVHATTGGNPWTAHQVLRLCAELDEQSRDKGLRELYSTTVNGGSLSFARAAARYLVLADTSPAVDAVAAAVVRDLGAASPVVPSGKDALLGFAVRCWLVGGAEADQPPALPDWLRRVLIASAPTGDWTATARQLATRAAGLPGRRVDELYYELACGEPANAVAYLNHRFDYAEPQAWITEFTAMVSAPCPIPRGTDALVEHGALFAGLRGGATLPPGDPHGERHITIAKMLIAGWLGADPTRDPERALAEALRQGYRDLERRSAAGLLRFTTEADRL
ncbi:hypothetical protein ACFPM7_27840 [Actinokineospora guangxiensis]|uniref:Uncharacterized protein n=1 Tax=Actinokineospora guangxiensis TaxID=1490288 RepID=A0ABW0EWY6_9PSEU